MLLLIKLRRNFARYAKFTRKVLSNCNKLGKELQKMMDLRLVFWETTRACNLECPHCRAQAQKSRSPDELSTLEAKSFIDQLSALAKPILVFSGGEALVREDIYELIHYAHSRGLKATLATNAALIDQDVAGRLKESGILLTAVSIYGSTAQAHDDFCGRPGAFARTLAGIENIKSAGIKLQINTTITRKNLSELENIGALALRLGAVSYHVFFLVPVGRGLALEGDEISPLEYEEAFNRLYDFQQNFPLHIKPTCAPHYYRILRQRSVKEKNNPPVTRQLTVDLSFCHSRESGNPGDMDSPVTPAKAGAGNDRIHPSIDRLHPSLNRNGFHAVTKGCLAGQGVCFVSYRGEVFGCGYLPLAAGDLRKQSFREIWLESELFKALRDDSRLSGKCGICEFKKVCGGCRARGYWASGDYLSPEPYCVYEPAGKLSE